MMKVDAARPQQGTDLREIARTVREADMLVHAHGGDLVPFTAELGEILELDRDPVLQREARDLRDREIILRLA